MVGDKSGNTYLLGSAYDSSSAFVTRAFLIKTSPNGGSIWVDTIYGIDELSILELDDLNNVYVTGRKFGTNYGDFYTCKFDSSGLLLWSKTFDGPDHKSDMPYAIHIDGSSNVYVAGSCAEAPSNVPEISMVKYNSNGDSLWSVIYHVTFQDWGNAYSVVTDNEENVYLLGRSLNSDSGSTILIKYDSNGNYKWKQRFGRNWSVCTLMSIYQNEFIYLAGTHQTIEHREDILCLKYDTAGNFIWCDTINIVDTLSFHPDDEPFAMEIDVAGNVIIGGCADCFLGSPNADGLILTISAGGNLLWKSTYTTPFMDHCNIVDLKLDNAGNIYATGFGTDIYWPIENIITFIYDVNGNLLNKIDYPLNPTHRNKPASISIDSSGNIYVAGWEANQNYYGFLTIKYSNNALSAPDLNEPDFSLYPNPFSTQFTLDLKSISNISIYNLIGEKLIDIKNASGTVTLGEELSSGMYILEIKNKSGETAVRKMVKVN